MFNNLSLYHTSVYFTKIPLPSMRINNIGLKQTTVIRVNMVNTCGDGYRTYTAIT